MVGGLTYIDNFNPLIYTSKHAGSTVAYLAFNTHGWETSFKKALGRESSSSAMFQLHSRWKKKYEHTCEVVNAFKNGPQDETDAK